MTSVSIRPRSGCFHQSCVFSDLLSHHRAELLRRHRRRLVAISDEPPLVYLVGPALRFHRAFDTIARALTPAVELYRFDLNEDWRAGVRVTRRCDLT